MSYRKFLSVLLLVVFLGFMSASGVLAQTPQTPLPGSSIPQFVTQLPTLTGATGNNMELLVGPSSDAAAPTSLFMKEFLANVLPSTPAFLPTYTGTSVFGYRLDSATTTADTYIGPVFVTSRGTPSAIKYINNLGSTQTTNVGVWKYSFDQTLHWADPNMQMGSLSPYVGPIPAVPHLHGGEVPAALDGGPEAWFLSNQAGWGTGYPTAWNSYDKTGLGYYTKNATDPTYTALYRYPNEQEAGPLWFHDHLLGGTRINVYSGLAGAYLLTDPNLVLPTGMNAVGLNNGTLNLTGVLGPTGANTELTIPLVIQDRMFDVNGQLYFPDVGINPEHPFWIPEFVGDAIVVNGRSWPNLNVEAKRYRFLVIEGSNARAYELFLVNPVTKAMGPPIWVIGTDGGYLDTPVKIDPNVKPNDKLIMMPGERYQIMIDFAGFAGQKLILRNTARTPYPKGAPPSGSTLGRIIQFTVGPVTSFTGADPSYNPATLTPIRTGNNPAKNNQKIKRLVNPVTGTMNPSVAVAKNRQLTLNEVMGMGGPLEVLVNNTKWSGRRPTGAMTSTPIPGFKSDGIGNYLSELPAEGTTEVWEIINMTADAHPIHTHLTQFQILNRQNFNVNTYVAAYNAAFQGGYDFVLDANVGIGVFIPAFGPPRNYNTFPGTTSLITGAPIVGGNPDVTRFLQGMPKPPLPQEAGWKDTAIMYPGQVTRIVVRYSPLDTAPGTIASYPFIPNPFNPNAVGGNLPNYDFVWHCHIVDHEDNEMMRPYQVISSGAGRTYVQPTHY